MEGLVEAQNWEAHRDRRKRISWPVSCTPLKTRDMRRSDLEINNLQFGLSAIAEDEDKIDDLIEKWLDRLEQRFASSPGEIGNAFDFSH